MAERGTNPTSIHEDAGDLDPLMKFSKLDVQSLRYLFFFSFLAASTAYGSSWARDQIRAIVASYAIAAATNARSLNPLHQTGDQTSTAREISQIINPLHQAGDQTGTAREINQIINPPHHSRNS